MKSVCGDQAEKIERPTSQRLDAAKRRRGRSKKDTACILGFGGHLQHILLARTGRTARTGGRSMVGQPAPPRLCRVSMRIQKKSRSQAHKSRVTGLWIKTNIGQDALQNRHQSGRSHSGGRDLSRGAPLSVGSGLRPL
ncbi:hypothetical protein GX51_00949 [Blastomyces parvus]|uniref:Uncharacterized protein n=1 Tax=Blastomyces parvus TaxID=2060905 RepID=A0A2B7XJP8_9EURO|nr:hypothetical protein GX51_00949 [Blastomyces parvus]